MAVAEQSQRSSTAFRARGESPEAVRLRVKRWRIAHPAGVRAIRWRRGGQAVLIEDWWAAALLADPCAYCGGASDQIDHVVPVARGGDSTADNLAGACKSCNSSKHATPLLLFLLRESR